MTIPADQQVRLKALDPERSFIVQAPAGSGKTEVLTQRFLRLLATVENPERVLAITFTRKATQEMRSRITSRLAQAQAGKRPETEHDQRAFDLATKVLRRDHERHWNLLENPGRLRITTIDGLCVQLLARDPVHGPMWSGIRVLEDATPLYREAIRRMFRDIDSAAEHAGAGDEGGRFVQDALVNVMVRLGGNGQRLEELLVDMLKRRNLWERHLEAGHDVLEELLKLRQENALQAFEYGLGKAHLDEAMGLVEALGGDVGSVFGRIEDRLRACYDFVKQFSTVQNIPFKPRSINRGKFPGMGAAQDSELDRLKEIFQQWHESDQALVAWERMASAPPLDPPESDDIPRQTLLDDVRSLLSLALYEFRSLSAERGETDFTAIADIAVESLGSDSSPGAAMLAEDERIDHVLMDEFQDTSFTQFSLMLGLTAGWQRGDGRTLFLVGDPMQSIYRFREANVGFFNEVVSSGLFGDIPVEPLSLTSNFRSRQVLIDWFNDSFPRIFPDRDESDSGAVSYTAVNSELQGGGHVGLHAFRDEKTVSKQNQKIVELVRNKLEQAPGETIAILVRSRNQIPQLTAELTSGGIRFEAVAMQALESRPVVIDLRIIMRALVHPLDRVAWIALLRAPWCGLTVAEIHRVVGDDHGEEILARICNPGDWSGLVPDSAERIKRLAKVMEFARRLASEHPLSELVEMCWIQLGGPLTCEDPSDIEDVQVFLDLLQEVEQANRDDVVQALDSTLQNRFAASRPAPVQVMTIHNAKGLQFDTVIVPGLARGTRPASQSLIELQEFSIPSGQTGVLMAPMTPSWVSDISLYRYLNKVDAERARFEAMRLLYVACTRAKSELHLLTEVRVTTTGKPTIPANSFLGFMADIFDPVIESALAQDPETSPQEPADTDNPPVLPLMRIANQLPPLDFTTTEVLPRVLTPGDLPNREAAALGTVLHEWLELVHDCSGEDWSRARIESSALSIRSGLSRAGAPAGAINRLEKRCVKILNDVLFDQGWLATLVTGAATGSWSELEMYQRSGSRFCRHVIDLMVQVPNGVFQIIDYKTRPPDETSAEKWEQQLARYRELVGKLMNGGVAETKIMVLERDEPSMH